MSKFCGNCGTQLDDNAKVCGNCGTLLTDSNNNVASSIPGIEYVAPEKKAKNKKIAKLFISGIALIAVAAIAINIVSGFVGYKGATRKIMNAYKNYDIDALVSMTSDVYFDTYDSQGIDYAVQNYEYIISDDLDSFENSVGHKYKISYEIQEAYKLPERNLNNLFDSVLSYNEYMEDYGISKVMVVKIKVTAKSGKKSSSTVITLYLTKENGSWKLFRLN